MTEKILGARKAGKGGVQGGDSALQTHTLPTPARKPDTAKAAVIITTRTKRAK